MKGIVVLDEIPKNCSKCMFNTGLNVCKIMKCIKAEKTVSIYTTDKQVLEKTKPDWCPIIQIPEKKRPSGLSPSPLIKGYLDSYKQGFNDCINKITGEK